MNGRAVCRFLKVNFRLLDDFEFFQELTKSGLQTYATRVSRRYCARRHRKWVAREMGVVREIAALKAAGRFTPQSYWLAVARHHRKRIVHGFLDEMAQS